MPMGMKVFRAYLHTHALSLRATNGSAAISPYFHCEIVLSLCSSQGRETTFGTSNPRADDMQVACPRDVLNRLGYCFRLAAIT